MQSEAISVLGVFMITMNDVNFENKRVFVRIDINCPVDKKTMAIQESDRLVQHAKTVRELSDKGAKVVVLGHQGRQGDYDFLHLEQHARLLEKHVGKPVTYIADVCGTSAKAAIGALYGGQIILLDNVRMVEDETKYKSVQDAKNSQIVKELFEFCDIFVLDGFSVSHRPHASVVGFFEKTVVAGRVMQAELEALDRVYSGKKPVVFVMGGAKPEDSIGIMEKFLAEGKADAIIACGVLGNLMIKSWLPPDKNLGFATESYLKEIGAAAHVGLARELLAQYGEKILLPQDVAYLVGQSRIECKTEMLPCNGPIMDIGLASAKKFAEILLGAGTIVINGPAGVYEQAAFEGGTRIILDAIEKSKAFSLAGGGHTIAAIEKFGVDRSKIGHISLSGKALISYLAGEKLAGVELVRNAKQ